jgi:hypothetical protein
VHEYNFVRPHHAFNHLTPHEAYIGMVTPNTKELIKKERVRRFKKNKNCACKAWIANFHLLFNILLQILVPILGPCLRKTRISETLVAQYLFYS